MSNRLPIYPASIGIAASRTLCLAIFLVLPLSLSAECIRGPWVDSSGDQQYCPPDCGGNPECSEMVDTQTRLVQEAIDQASAFWEQKNWKSALGAYQEALGFCEAQHSNCQFILDNMASARTNIAYANRDNAAQRGDNYWRQKNWQAAISAYQEALGYCLAGIDCQYLRDNIEAAREHAGQ